MTNDFVCRIQLMQAVDEVAALQARVAELEAQLASGSFYKETDIDNLTARAEAAEARAAELEAERDVYVGISATWCSMMHGKLIAAEALLSEAVKAGMLEGAKMIQPAGEKPDVDPSNMGDVQDEAFWLADRNASTRIRALASEPASIARIVAQLKEDRG